MNGKIYVTETNRNIRALALQTLRGNWGNALLIILLGTAITSLPGFVVGRLTNSYWINMIVNMYSLIIHGPVNLGLAVFFLKVFRQQEAGINDMASGFDIFRSASMLYLTITLRVLLMSFLFVIPGVIAAIRYSQAFFVLADDPSKNPFQCIYESAIMMEGNKMKYFLFNLSYIGWYIVAGIPQVAFEATLLPDISAYSPEQLLDLAATIRINPMVSVLGLLSVLVTVYVSCGHACFYDLVSGNLFVQNSAESGF